MKKFCFDLRIIHTKWHVALRSAVVGHFRALSMSTNWLVHDAALYISQARFIIPQRNACLRDVYFLIEMYFLFRHYPSLIETTYLIYTYHQYGFLCYIYMTAWRIRTLNENPKRLWGSKWNIATRFNEKTWVRGVHFCGELRQRKVKFWELPSYHHQNPGSGLRLNVGLSLLTK